MSEAKGSSYNVLHLKQDCNKYIVDRPGQCGVCWIENRVNKKIRFLTILSIQRFWFVSKTNWYLDLHCVRNEY